MRYRSGVRLALPLICVAAAACGEPIREKHLDTDLIKVTTEAGGAKLRTDVLGDGKFAETATFVLVDAENTAEEGAYVTLDGTLADAGGKPIGELKAQSLWIPAHESRTYALVDALRKPRPDAAGAEIRVKGALVPAYGPTATITDVQVTDDRDKVVVAGKVTNPTDRPGRIVVIGSFHDKKGTPMTRPFGDVVVEPHASLYVQYVGPRGSARAQLYLGDETY